MPAILVRLLWFFKDDNVKDSIGIHNALVAIVIFSGPP